MCMNCVEAKAAWITWICHVIGFMCVCVCKRGMRFSNPFSFSETKKFFPGLSLVLIHSFCGLGSSLSEVADLFVFVILQKTVYLINLIADNMVNLTLHCCWSGAAAAAAWAAAAHRADGAGEEQAAPQRVLQKEPELRQAGGHENEGERLRVLNRCRSWLVRY